MSDKIKKSCWIIGASHGIGQALAQKYYNAGYDIIISARSTDKLKSFKKELEIKNSKNQIVISDFDVTNYQAFVEAAKKIVKKFKKIDLAIFAPAIYEQMGIFDFDIELSHKIMNTNFNSCLNFLHIITPYMAAQKSGHIALIASVAGYAGLPNSLAYGASKAAMINLAEGIYGQLKSKNIDLSIINPGFVKTRLTKKNDFPMPFIISQDQAATEIVRGLEQKKFEIHFPKRFTLFLKILRLLPYKVFFFITKRII